MALQKALISVLFSQGLDTKTDSKLVIPGKLTRLENGVFKKGGTISKRNGYEALRAEINRFSASPAALATGNALGTFDRELLQFSSGTLYTRASSLDSWIDRGYVPNTNLQTSTVIQNSYEQTKPSRAEHQNVKVIACEDTRGGIRAKVVAADTGAVYQADVLIDASGQEPRCVRIGDFLFVFYRIGQNLKFQRLNPLDPLSFETALTLVTDMQAAHPFWDIQSRGSWNDAVFAYKPEYTDYSTNYVIRVGYVTPSGDIGGPGTGHPTVASFPIDAFRGGLGLAVNESGNKIGFMSLYSGYNFTGAQTPFMASSVFSSSLETPDPHAFDFVGSTELSGTVQNMTCAFTSELSIDGYYTVKPIGSASSDAYIKTFTHASSSAIATGTGSFGGVFMRSVGLASQAFSYGTSSYVAVVHDAPLQPSYFLARGDKKIVGRSLYAQAGGLISGTTKLPPVQNMGDGQYKWTPSVRGQLQSASGSVYTLRGVGETTISFDDATTCYANEQIDKNLIIAGGMTLSYDGTSTVEHGFLLFPEGLTSSLDEGGSLVTSGTYQYATQYRWTDDRGLRQRSAASVPLTVVLTGSQSAAMITSPTLRVTNKKGNRADAVIELYRTQNEGTTFYKVAQTTNSTSADTVSFIDTASDSAIASNELLDSTGGVLEAFPPEAASIICVHGNRVVLAGLETDSNKLLYSKTQVENEGIAFHPDLTKRVDPYGGYITALSSLYGDLIIFKRDAIFVMTGDGPNDTGNDDNFSEPTRFDSDVGCIDARSVVSMPHGLMFKSSKGIYLFDKKSSRYIGAPVEAYNDDTVVSAVLLQDKNQVRFLLDSGVCLVYDYFFGQWSVFKNHRQAVDATIWNGDFAYLRSDGEARKEVSGQYTDAGSNVPMLLESAWIKLNGVQGYGRVYKMTLLGEFKSQHFLRVEFAYDYNDVWEPAYTFDTSGSLSSDTWGSDAYWGSGSVWGGSSDNVYQFSVDMPWQTCEAVKMRIYDVGSSGESFSISEAQFLVGVKQGPMRLPVGKKGQ